MKYIIAIVLSLALSFTVHAQNISTPTGTIVIADTKETVLVSTAYSAQNVPAADIAAKIADAQAKCPSGQKVANLTVYLNRVTGLYTISAFYR